jgi:hypothetical protein
MRFCEAGSRKVGVRRQMGPIWYTIDVVRRYAFYFNGLGVFIMAPNISVNRTCY